MSCLRSRMSSIDHHWILFTSKVISACFISFFFLWPLFEEGGSREQNTLQHPLHHASLLLWFINQKKKKVKNFFFLVEEVIVPTYLAHKAFSCGILRPWCLKATFTYIAAAFHLSNLNWAWKTSYLTQLHLLTHSASPVHSCFCWVLHLQGS